MNSEQRRILIDYRMERAKESAEAAQLLYENNMLTSAMNRIYYSLFYAVQALLVLKNVSFSKHGQVKGYFNKEFIKTGLLPIELGKFYNNTFEFRQKFDYVDFSIPESAVIFDYIQKAKSFISQIEAYIQKIECQNIF
jgi:uncharacterized protein (UPF0332 family)